MRTEILVIAGIVMCEPAWADLTPKSHIGIAGIDFQANAATSSGYVKNITYQPYARDAKDSLFNSITPTLIMSGERYQDKYLLMYSGDYRHYDKHPAGFAPIFPDTCYHLIHYWPAAADIPVASDNPVHYADAIRYNARTPLQGSLLPLTRLV